MQSNTKALQIPEQSEMLKNQNVVPPVGHDFTKGKGICGDSCGSYQ